MTIHQSLHERAKHLPVHHRPSPWLIPAAASLGFLAGLCTGMLGLAALLDSSYLIATCRRVLDMPPRRPGEYGSKDHH